MQVPLLMRIAKLTYDHTNVHCSNTTKVATQITYKVHAITQLQMDSCNDTIAIILGKVQISIEHIKQVTNTTR